MSDEDIMVKITLTLTRGGRVDGTATYPKGAIAIPTTVLLGVLETAKLEWFADARKLKK